MSTGTGIIMPWDICLIHGHIRYSTDSYEYIILPYMFGLSWDSCFLYPIVGSFPTPPEVWSGQSLPQLSPSFYIWPLFPH
jgi:hypothetical protein